MDKLEEVRNTTFVNETMDAFRNAYYKRYRVMPVEDLSGSDNTIIRDLIKIFGRKRATNIIESYIRMDNDWFVTKGHSLDVLKKNINAVNAHTREKEVQPESNLRMMWRIPCITCNCNNHVEVTGTLGELNLAMNATKCNIHTDET